MRSDQTLVKHGRMPGVQNVKGGDTALLLSLPLCTALSPCSHCRPQPYGITNHRGCVQQWRRLISVAAASPRKRYNRGGESMRELFCAKPAHLLLENNQGTHIFVGWISARCCSDSLQTEFPPSSLHSPLLKKVLKKKKKKL